MFSRFQRFYNSIKLLADVCTLGLAFLAAYAVRFTFFAWESVPPRVDTLVTLGLVLVVFPVVFRQQQLYTTNRNRSHIGEVFEIFKATVVATLVLVAVTYFTRERYSRLTIVTFAGFAFVGVSVVRLATRAVFNELRRRGVNVKTVLVVGAGALGQRFLEAMQQHRELGFKAVGLLSRHPEKVGSTVAGVPVLGGLDELERVLDETPVDQVVLALPGEEQARLPALMSGLALRTVDVKVVPDILGFVTLRGGFEEFGGLPVIGLQGAPLEGWNRIAKRVFDASVSAVALVLLAPVMLLIALAVKLSSPGPVFYAQERMGMDGRLFKMLKFRTMLQDAEARGPRFATAKDDRRTALGVFLRRSSLDELPQFWNVLVGDMSLVGPRPERPVFIEAFKKEIPRYHLRHMVKSGITGWAQVNGLRGDTSIRDRIDFDLYYIEHWSLGFDLKILVRTALGGFLSRNAY